MITKVSFVVPCLNEAGSVGDCVREIAGSCAQMGIEPEILVVDNGSSDASARVAQEAGAVVVSEPTPGYGRALRRGIRQARHEYIITGD